MKCLLLRIVLDVDDAEAWRRWSTWKGALLTELAANCAAETGFCLELIRAWNSSHIELLPFNAWLRRALLCLQLDVFGVHILLHKVLPILFEELADQILVAIFHHFGLEYMGRHQLPSLDSLRHDRNSIAFQSWLWRPVGLCIDELTRLSRRATAILIHLGLFNYFVADYIHLVHLPLDWSQVRVFNAVIKLSCHSCAFHHGWLLSRRRYDACQVCDTCLKSVIWANFRPEGQLVAGEYTRCLHWLLANIRCSFDYWVDNLIQVASNWLVPNTKAVDWCFLNRLRVARISSTARVFMRWLL